MQSGLEDIRKADAQVVAVCVDSVEQNAKVVENLKLGYTILSDPDLKVTKAYDLLHEGASIDSAKPDVARPAVFIIGRDGVVRWRNLTENYRIRVRPETVVEALSKIP